MPNYVALSAGLMTSLLAFPTLTASSQESSSKHFPEFEFRKWSGEINVPDPVAVSVDSKGRVYATQTRRRKIQDLDIRSNREWIPDDLGLQTVQEKREFFERVLAIGGDDAEQSKHVDDVNQDGVHDWRDLTVISEVIYRLVDSDRDGTADEMTIFAEDFKTEVTGIAAGVLAFAGDVYATVAPDLWKLQDHDDDGVSDSRQSLAHGFGVHIAYGGHDMHGPTVGPDGKIYWSIGDKGINVTTTDGRNVAYPNQGGVMRCNPDGSDFEVFAHGLRNVQEIAFDPYGNMFGVDNDSDQPGEKERFIYIVDSMDAGWRCNYQYRGSHYNPWTAERLWELPGESHAAYIIPPIRHSIDGPAGFKFNPGTALSPEYKDFFFLSGAPNGNQYAFRVEVDGDSFRMVDEHEIGSGLAIVGLAFGPDGGLYGADWDGGYPLDELGSIIRIDVPGAGNSAERQEVRQLLAEGFSQLGRADLVALLGHADQRVRQGAQFALVDMDAGNMLASVAVSENSSRLQRLHSLWGLGQVARRGDNMGRDILGLLLKDQDHLIRAQAAKTYGELKETDGYALVVLLDDEDLPVRTLAGIALGRQPTSKAVAPLLKQSDALTATQYYLRHSIVTALASCATPEQLSGEVESDNEMRRMCCVLALRRQGHPSVSDYLHDASDWVATEAARAIHDDKSIADALPKLALAMSERDHQREEFSRRAINANFRIGSSAGASRVLEFAMSERHPVQVRLDAIGALAEWNAPPLLDRLDGRRRQLPLDSRDVDPVSLAVGFGALAASSNPQIRAATLAAARKLAVQLPIETLHALASNFKNDEATRIEALNSLAERPKGLLPTLNRALESKSAAIQARALVLMSELFPRRSLSRLSQVVEEDFATSVKQSAIASLAKLPNGAGADVLRDLARQLQEGTLESSLALDLEEAVTHIPELRDEVQFATDKFAYSRDGGNAKLGQELFETHLQAQCSRCHKIGGEGSEIGPELTKIARTRDADYLLRAISQPSADIDAKYRSQILLLSSGNVIKGVIQSQDDQQTVVADSSGKLLRVKTEEIEESSEQKISLMPDMSDILTAREIRDLVAYMRSLK